MNFKKLWHLLSKRRHKQFYLLIILIILASLMEVISVGAILPFLGVLIDPEKVYQFSMMRPIIEILGITAPNQIILPITIIFITAVFLAGLIRLLLLYAITKFSYSTGADLSIEIYRRTLYQDYSVHVSRNSSAIINGVITQTNIVIGNIINPVLIFISSSVLITAILLALFAIDPFVASVSFMGFGLIYLLVIYYTKKKLIVNSEVIAEQSTQMIKALQEGLGGIRDVLIDGSQKFYSKLYRNADLPLRMASASNVFINGSPRYVIEAVGMILIACLAYGMSLREGGLNEAIPILGALALGAQRLLPALQQAYGSYANIKAANASFKDVLGLLEQPLPNYARDGMPEPISFKKEIRLNSVSFNYKKDSPLILDKISLAIEKGSRIGFIGETGSGKSTLLDVIMGLLSPTQGSMEIDGQPINVENNRTWQAHIAHVPQNIHLSDSTIEENIAFGVPKNEINHQRVEGAAKQAKISESIKEWKKGYQSYVGENGVRLSGGQRQRIGIARALYKKADVLIFDEATSALDNATEHAVMDSIESLGRNLTILIIAHRITTLEGCDQIIRLSNGAIVKIGTYEEMSQY